MPDAYTLALGWLSARELSTAQVRTRLLRRRVDPDEVEAAIRRLTAAGALDDRRVARAAARDETVLRLRGPHRATQRLRRLGIEGDVARDAVAAVFEEVDRTEILDAALARQLRRQPVDLTDPRAAARLTRALVAQGFSPDEIFASLRAWRAAGDRE